MGPELSADRPTIRDVLWNRKPPNVPAAYWRRLQSLRPWAGVFGASWMVFLLYYLDGIGSRLMAGAGVVAMCVVILLFRRAPQVIKDRLQHEVVEANYHVCIECGYHLAGLPAEYRCPECGSQYRFQQLEHRWKEWFDVDQKRRKGHH